MKFVADENIDQPIVAALRQDGHDVLCIADQSPSLPDDAVLNEANSQNAILITADRDFGELVFRQRRVHTGVVLIRLAGMEPQAKAVRLCQATNQHGSQFINAFSVITPGFVRIRHQA